MRILLPVPLLAVVAAVASACAEARPEPLHLRAAFTGTVTLACAKHESMRLRLAFARASRHLQCTWERPSGAVTLQRAADGAMRAFAGDAFREPSPEERTVLALVESLVWVGGAVRAPTVHGYEVDLAEGPCLVLVVESSPQHGAK